MRPPRQRSPPRSGHCSSQPGGTGHAGAHGLRCCQVDAGSWREISQGSVSECTSPAGPTRQQSDPTEQRPHVRAHVKVDSRRVGLGHQHGRAQDEEEEGGAQGDPQGPGPAPGVPGLPRIRGRLADTKLQRSRLVLRQIPQPCMLLHMGYARSLRAQTMHLAYLSFPALGPAWRSPSCSAAQ